MENRQTNQWFLVQDAAKKNYYGCFVCPQVFRVVTIAALVALCRGDATNSSSTTAAAAAPQPDALGPGYNRTRRSDVLGLFNTKLHKKYALLGSLSSSNHHLPEITGPDCGHPLTVSTPPRPSPQWEF